MLQSPQKGEGVNSNKTTPEPKLLGRKKITKKTIANSYYTTLMLMPPKVVTIKIINMVHTHVNIGVYHDYSIMDL